MTRFTATPGQTYPAQYSDLFQQKVQQQCLHFKGILPSPPELFASPSEHFRMRAEFGIWHEGEESFFTMHEPSPPHKKIYITHYPIGSSAINTIMPRLLAAIHKDELLRKRLFSVEFLSNKAGDVLVTLLYHKKLDDEWRQAAQTLQEHLGQQVIGRSRKQKVLLKKDFINEIFTVGNQKIHYQQIENSFTQPNAFINQQMLNWVYQQTLDIKNDALELYCGNGNFTLALAKNFNQVLATEVSKVSIRSAQYNAQLNQFNNIQVVRLSSEEAACAINREREFRRLKDIDLDSYHFSSIFVDPPRAGLDDKTLQLVSQFDNIIYISCNPETLRQNVLSLQSTHHVTQSAFFDQFPYTDHLECGLILKKKN